MDSMEGVSRESAARIVSPVVYATLFLFMAFLVSMMLLSFGFSQLPVPIYYGVPLLLFGLAFGLCGWATLRMERLFRPRLMDHLRRTAFLYVGLAVMSFVFVLGAHQGGSDVGYAFLLIGGVFAVYAISIDGLILTLARLRSGRRLER